MINHGTGGFILKTVLIVIAIFFAVGCRKGNPVEVDSSVQRYFPLAAGNSWDFDETTDLGGGDTTVAYQVVLDSPIVFDGLKWYGVQNNCVDSRVLNPIPLHCARWARNGNKILSQRDGPGPALGLQETILDFPLLKGKQWTIYSTDTTYIQAPGDTIHMVSVSKRYVQGFETVTVPFGRISNVAHVLDSTWYEYTNTHPARPFHESDITATDEWYAVDIGMVKQITRISSTSTDTSPISTYWLYEVRKYNVRVND